MYLYSVLSGICQMSKTFIVGAEFHQKIKFLVQCKQNGTDEKKQPIPDFQASTFFQGKTVALNR